VLTLACGKYRFNDLNWRNRRIAAAHGHGAVQRRLFGHPGGRGPAGAFNLRRERAASDAGTLWYEQRPCAYCLRCYPWHQNIYLGPSFRVYLAAVLKVLVEKFDIKPVSTRRRT